MSIRTDTHSQGGWTFKVTRGPILNASESDRYEHEFGFHLPEMVFGHSQVSLQHVASGCEISFRAIDALRGCLHPSTVKVSSAVEWTARGVDTEYHTNSDWTFSTDYRGTTTGSWRVQSSSSDSLPMDLLRRQDPIQFYGEAILFEDELHDSGLSMLSVKLRVMPKCFLALMRFVLRVDGVEVRVRDTRVCHVFGTDYVLREYVARRATYADLAARGLLPATAPPAAAEATAGSADDAMLSPPVIAPDPAALADQLPIEHRLMETLRWGV